MITHSPSAAHYNTRLILSVVLLAIGFCNSCEVRSTQPDAVAKAFEQRQSDVIVDGQGVVSRVLSDDKEGSRHQRFIVRLSSGQTVLIQHNIDVAPRISHINEGDVVSFSGEYIWNEQGGIIHWTHHDPAGRHVGGWIKHLGRMYE